MENKKNDDSYDNESYLDKRVKPDDLQNIGVLDEIGNKTEEKSTNSSEKGDEIKPIKNIDDGKLEDTQKEMHPEIVRKKNKDFTKPLALGIIALIIIGVIAVVFLMPLINIQKKEDPQQIIKSSMQEMQKVKTYSYEGIIEFEVENKENSEGFNFDIELLGKADQADINNIKSFNNIKIIANVDMDGGDGHELSFDELSFDLDTMQFGQKKTYLKLNDFDLGIIGIKIGPQFNSFIDSFKEKWYQLDLEEYLYQPYTPSGDIIDVDMPTYDINKIMELYNKYELLKFQEDLGDVKLGNVDAYHYNVKLDGVALADFYIDVLKEMTDEQDFDETSIETYDMMFGEIEEGIKKYDYVINEIANSVNMEIWIGKEDRLIYRTKINGLFDEEFAKTLGNKIVEKGDDTEEKVSKDIENMDSFEIAFNIDVNMKNFNQPVEINEPEEAENFMEVLKIVFFNSYGNIEPVDLDKWREKGEDFDNDGLPDEIETIYGSDPNNPDTDGDGYTDGEEIASGYDPLISGDARLDYDKLFKTQ